MSEKSEAKAQAKADAEEAKVEAAEAKAEKKAEAAMAADAKSADAHEYEVIGSIWMDNVAYQGTPEGENNPVVTMTGQQAARLVAAGNLRRK